ncbi:MAG: hypothetical protein KBH29_06080 [Lutibacter sp.]|nr:hypothetical protein [Lutibacter sp.]
MKKELKDIKPGIGLGNLKFGMSRAEVKLMLGEPTFVDKYSHSDSDEDLTESWEYEELELSMSFDEDEDWKLTMMSVTAKHYQLEGISLIGLKEKYLLQKLETLDLGSLDLEETEIDGQKVIEVEEQSINFWLMDGELDEIQWSPLFEDDDTIIWPK